MTSQGPLSGRQPQAVHSALVMLEAVAQLGPGVTARELSSYLGLPASTTYRLANLLVTEGYLVRMPAGFALGRHTTGLAPAVADLRVPQAARAQLSRIRAATRWAVHLASFTSRQVRIVDPDPVHPPTPAAVLARHPHASALGKLLLAEHPHWQRLVPGGRLVALTENTVTSVEILGRQLSRAAAVGRAEQVSELAVSRACLAMAIRDDSGILVAGIAVSGSADGWADRRKQLLATLGEAVTGLTPLLT